MVKPHSVGPSLVVLIFGGEGGGPYYHLNIRLFCIKQLAQTLRFLRANLPVLGKGRQQTAHSVSFIFFIRILLLVVSID